MGSKQTKKVKESDNNLSDNSQLELSSTVGQPVATDAVQVEHVLPPGVQRRVDALYKIMDDMRELDEQYGRLFHELPQLYDPLFDKRRRIVTGQYEPKPSDLPHNCPLVNTDAMVDTDVVGIPDFWLNVLKCSPQFKPWIQDFDEPILKHLVDIQLKKIDGPNESALLVIDFHFSANEYFANDVLTKKLDLLLDNEGCGDQCNCRAIGSICTPIEWMDGKDVTIINPSKQSFFGFFWTSTAPVDEMQKVLLKRDFLLGCKLLGGIIELAVMYFISHVNQIQRQMNQEMGQSADIAPQ